MAIIEIETNQFEMGGGSDVGDALNAALRESTLDAEEGDTIVIGGNGVFRSDHGLTWGTHGRTVQHPDLAGYAPRGLTLDLTKCRLTTPYVNDARNRWGAPVLTVYQAHECAVLGGEYVGDNAQGASGLTREEWFGIKLVSCVDFSIEQPIMWNVWSDYVYLVGPRSAPCRQVTIRGLHGEKNGRQGITALSAAGLTVEDSTFRAKRCVIDHEPSVAAYGLTDFLMQRCVTNGGPVAFANIKALARTMLSNFAIRDHHITDGHYNCVFQTGNVPRENVELARLTSDETTPWAHPSGSLLTFGKQWHGINVTDMHERFTAGTRSRAVKVGDGCVDVTIYESGFVTV